MKKKNNEESGKCYNYITSLTNQYGQSKDADELLKEIEEARDMPDIPAYQTDMLNGFAIQVSESIEKTKGQQLDKYQYTAYFPVATIIAESVQKGEITHINNDHNKPFIIKIDMADFYARASNENKPDASTRQGLYRRLQQLNKILVPWPNTDTFKLDLYPLVTVIGFNDVTLDENKKYLCKSIEIACHPRFKEVSRGYFEHTPKLNEQLKRGPARAAALWSLLATKSHMTSYHIDLDSLAEALGMTGKKRFEKDYRRIADIRDTSEYLLTCDTNLKAYKFEEGNNGKTIYKAFFSRDNQPKLTKSNKKETIKKR